MVSYVQINEKKNINIEKSNILKIKYQLFIIIEFFNVLRNFSCLQKSLNSNLDDKIPRINLVFNLKQQNSNKKLLSEKMLHRTVRAKLLMDVQL